MESIRRNFFNGVDIAEKKMSLISWKKVLASKKNGGLGVSSFFAMNRALLFKWVWRYISNGSSLWSCFITAIHGSHRALISPLSRSKRSPWNVIVRELTSFWEDVWLGDSPLKHTYLRLYFLELNKHASVASKLSNNSITDSFRRLSRGEVEEEQLALLNSKTSTVSLSNLCDRWIWRLDSLGLFSVKSARKFIDEAFLPKSDTPYSIG
ncbi:hypothetical protein Tco_1090165 [Tanacetum coccineum]|uniref:RNA-directed DNA polymerase, eukaryota, reverse transcriptase zinc-binding domain protein n=1 Tax=Tanacetum coccineum TaxID=301880 RepID=A0ABQ5I523_9ASTR